MTAETWSQPVDISRMLGPLWSPRNDSTTHLSVGPGAGMQLSASNKFAPNRILFAGHHGAYTYDCVWYSDGACAACALFCMEPDLGY